jgi:DNA-binding NarL/FixJ family response regulator
MAVTAGTIRILLVDDHPVLRAGLSRLLSVEPDLLVVGQTGSGETAVEMWRQAAPDVCLLDWSMPGMTGLETLHRIRGLAFGARVIVLTSSESPDDAATALHEGASAYITKNVDHEEIVAAIREVHAGRTGLRKGVATAAPRPPAAILSQRELEVLTLLRSGLNNAEIGRRLGITQRTARFHVSTIFEKLGVSDRTAAVSRAFDLGLLRAAAPT